MIYILKIGCDSIKNSIFMAIGGGNEIGASSYYIQLENIKLLLDCGIRNCGRKYPLFESLIEKKIINSINELNTIIISHAHKDHFAALSYIANIQNTRIISTPQTKSKLLNMVDIFDRKNFFVNEDEYFNLKHIVSSIATYNYFEPFNCSSAELLFLPAGHIDGAAMTVICYNGNRIIYTGDFSVPLSEKKGDEQLAFKFIRECEILIIENTYGYSKNKISINSKHANFNNLVDLIQLAYPKQLFLIHQQEKFNSWSIEDEIKTKFPTIKVEKTYNMVEYELEVSL